MFETQINEKTVTIKLKHRYVVDLLLACETVGMAALAGHESAEKWDYLHDLIREQLDAFDEKHGVTA